MAEILDLVSATKPRLLVAAYASLERAKEGVAVLRRARRLHRGLRCVVVEAPDVPADIEKAFAAGASVYCPKSADENDVAVALCQVSQESVYYAGSLWHPREETARAASEIDGSVALTATEVEILRLVAEGRSNDEVAKLLWVTESTVKFHLNNIYGKLHVRNRTSASRWAERHGLLVEAGG